MNVEQMADWAAVVIAVSWLALVVGIGVGKVLALMDQVAKLEDFAGSVTYELVSQEHELDIRLLRDRMDRFEHEHGGVRNWSNSDVA